MSRADVIEARLLKGPSGLGPMAATLLDEVLLDEVQAGRLPALLRLWINDLCVVLGRNNKEEEWIHSEALNSDNVPYFHRDSGGGTVVHHPYNLNFTWIVPRNHLPGVSPKSAIGLFLSIVVEALAHLGIRSEMRGVSDVFVGEWKVSGNAERFKSRAVLHHGTILLRSETERMDRYLKTPPNRPDVMHDEFVKGLWDAGYPVGFERLSESLARATAEVLGWRLSNWGIDSELIDSAERLAKERWNKQLSSAVKCSGM